MTIAGICIIHGFFKGDNCSLCEREINEVFYTSRDKLWEFETRFLNKEVQIRTKGQWKRFMREHKLHDDVPKKPDFTKPTYKPVPRQEIAKSMMEKLQKDGTYHKLVPELKKALKRR